MRNRLVSEANLRVTHRQSLFKALIMQSASEKTFNRLYHRNKKFVRPEAPPSGQTAMGSNAFDHKRIFVIC